MTQGATFFGFAMVFRGPVVPGGHFVIGGS